MKPLTYGLPDEGARQGARATIYDVARTAGVSPATVSRFLNGTARVAVSTQRRIEDAVRAHAFAPNAIAQSLATRASKTIAVLVPDITNPFFPELVKGVQEHAEERDFALVLSDTGSRIERELRYLEVARRKQVDGVILVSARMPEELLEGLPEQGITAVAIDPRRERPGQMSISLSHGLGAARATEHLIELGHLRIAHLCGPKGIHASRERLTGFRTAMARAGITVSAAAVVQAGFTEESGRRGVELLLEREVPFSALFAANDLCAIGAIDYLQKQGLHVPGDVSVIGIDGISLGRYTRPAVTTMLQPMREIGRTAAQMLIDRLEGTSALAPPERAAFVPELLIRGSTAPAAGSSSALEVATTPATSLL